MNHDQKVYIYTLFNHGYWTILKLILAQLPMKKLIKVKTNHN
jgi:hypothetical protein